MFNQPESKFYFQCEQKLSWRTHLHNPHRNCSDLSPFSISTLQTGLQSKSVLHNFLSLTDWPKSLRILDFVLVFLFLQKICLALSSSSSSCSCSQSLSLNLTYIIQSKWVTTLPEFRLFTVMIEKHECLKNVS